jgi:hypothetical protein
MVRIADKAYTQSCVVFQPSLLQNHLLMPSTCTSVIINSVMPPAWLQASDCCGSGDLSHASFECSLFACNFLLPQLVFLATAKTPTAANAALAHSDPSAQTSSLTARLAHPSHMPTPLETAALPFQAMESTLPLVQQDLAAAPLDMHWCQSSWKALWSTAWRFQMLCLAQQWTFTLRYSSSSSRFLTVLLCRLACKPAPQMPAALQR